MQIHRLIYLPVQTRDLIARRGCENEKHFSDIPSISYHGLSPVVQCWIKQFWNCETQFFKRNLFIYCMKILNGMACLWELEMTQHYRVTKVQDGWGGWPTGNGNKLSNSQACCLAQLCLAGCCLIYFHFLCAIHPIRPVGETEEERRNRRLPYSSQSREC